MGFAEGENISFCAVKLGSTYVAFLVWLVYAPDVIVDECKRGETFFLRSLMFVILDNFFAKV